jgi:D-tyrosyl-tRNA(Tyr) deacylase
MKLLIQRVTHAQVIIDEKIYSHINKGYCIFLGIKETDTEKDIDTLINKILKIGLFEGDNKYFSKSITEIEGEILLISQFTLYGRLDKGKKPSFTDAMNPKDAENLYDKFAEKLKEQYPKVQTGKFAAYMKVELENDGPATFILDS